MIDESTGLVIAVVILGAVAIGLILCLALLVRRRTATVEIGAEQADLGQPSWLQRRRRPIFWLSVFVAATAIVSVWTLIEPVYEATALIRVSPVVPRILMNQGKDGVVPLYHSFVKTEMSIMRSDVVLNRVLDNSEVQKTQWYRQKPKSLRNRRGNDPPTHLQRLREALSVRLRPNTELIDVSSVLPSAKEAALIVNLLVDEYVMFTGEREDEINLQRRNRLEDEYEKAQKAVAGIIAARSNLLSVSGASDPEELLKKSTEDLAALEHEYEELKRNLGMTQHKLSAAPADANKAELERLASEQEYELDLIKQEIEAQSKKLREAGQLAKEVARFDEDLRRKRAMAEQLRNAMEELKLEAKAPARISVAAYAVAPTDSTGDRRIHYTILVILLLVVVLLVLGRRPQEPATRSS